MRGHGEGCPVGIRAATRAYNVTDAGPLELPAGFRHFLGEPNCRFRWRGSDPRLQPDARAEMRRHMAVVAAAMEAAPDPAGKPRLPSGYTYALQLVAHDMVDTSLPFWAMSQGAETRNLQTRPLRLNTVYGAGPGLFPLAYSADPASGQPIAFRLGPVHGRSGEADPVPAGRDIPRVSLATTMDGAAARGLNAALVADGRNDQHLLLSQMTVIFMLLHNAILAALPPVADTDLGAAEHAVVAESRFACAKAATVLIYRDVLRYDILRHILNPRVLALYDAGRPLLERESRERGIPLEFTHGAFRFGHAMVRSDYQFGSTNDLAAKHPIRDILHLNSGMSGLGIPFDTSWVVDWSNFLPLASADPPNMARPIGATSQRGFVPDMRFGPIHPDVGKTGVAIRDLMSAGLAGLWSVWALIDAIRQHPAAGGFAPLLAETRAGWRAQLATWRAALPAGQLGDTTMQALEDDPPLPFFVLLEAASASEHPGLGVLGSVIVAETIFGTLARDRLPVEQVADDQHTRMCRLGEMHGLGNALSELPVINSLAGILRFLAGTSVWRDARPPLFTATNPP